MRQATTLAILLCILVPLDLLAQESDEPRFEDFRAHFQREYFSPGILVQTVGVFGESDRPGNNGFSLATARLKVGGQFDRGFSYKVQTDFTRSVSLLDAYAGYSPSENTLIRAGVFKAPFSAGVLVSSASTDFINRAAVVSNLAPSRQVGAAFRLRSSDRRLSAEVGVFNGNGRTFSGNDNDKFMWAGRVAASTSADRGILEVGGNIAYSDDSRDDFDLTRFLVGVDARYESESILLSGELIRSDVSSDGLSVNPYGAHITAGYNIEPGRHQILARIDHYDSDSPEQENSTTDYFVAGYNFWPSSAFEIQINYLLPISDSGFHSVLVNFQAGF